MRFHNFAFDKITDLIEVLDLSLFKKVEVSLTFKENSNDF